MSLIRIDSCALTAEDASTIRGRLLLVTVVLASTILTSCGGTASRNDQPAANASATRSSPSGPVGQMAACNNPFYPTSSTARWQYNAAFGSKQITLSVNRIAIEFGTFTDHLEFSDGSVRDVSWRCFEEGLLCSEFVPVDLRHFPAALKLKYTRGSGATLPPINSWNVGYHWVGNFVVTGQPGSRGSDGEEASGTVDLDNKIVASGKVTVPAGTFDAFQVDTTMLETLTIGSGSAAGNTLRVSVKVSAWYARDVGLVKIAFSGDPGTGSEELTSFTK